MDVYQYYSGTGLSGYNLRRLDRLVRARDRDPADARQRGRQHPLRGARRPRPVGRLDARVVRALAAAAAQLRRRPRRPLGRAAARHPRGGPPPEPRRSRRPAAASRAWSDRAEPAGDRDGTSRRSLRRSQAGGARGGAEAPATAARILRAVILRAPARRPGRARPVPPPRQPDDRRHLRPDPDRRGRSRQRLRAGLRRRPAAAATAGRSATAR